MALARSLRALVRSAKSCSEPLLRTASLAAASLGDVGQPLLSRSREQATQQLYSNYRYPDYDTFSGHYGTAGFGFSAASPSLASSCASSESRGPYASGPFASANGLLHVAAGFLAMLPVTAMASGGDAGTDDASGSAAGGVAGRAAGSASGVAGGASGPSAAGEDGDGSRGEVGGVGVVRVSRGSVGCVRHVWTLRALLPAPPV